MAQSFIGNTIEFLVGLIILPRLVTLLWMFIVPYFGLDVQTALIAYLVLSGVLILITFFIRTMVGVGFLVGTIWDVVSGYFALFG